MYYDRPSTLLWFLCQHHAVHCTSRQYMAGSCWGFSSSGRFPRHTGEGWPVLFSLLLLPPTWSGMRQRIGVPQSLSHCSAECSMAELWWSGRMDFFPDLMGSLGFQNKVPCLPLNVLGIFNTNAIAFLVIPAYSWDTHRPQLLPNFQCLLWMLVVGHQGNRCHITALKDEQMTRKHLEFTACREKEERGRSLLVLFS